MAVTIIPAVITPRVMGKIAFWKGIPNNQAAIDPVQAPVMGKGMATKKNNAQGPYFSIFWEVLSRVLWNIQFSILFIKEECFCANIVIFSNPNIKMKTGIILPIIANQKTSKGFSPQEIARGIDPLSSVIGKAEYKIVKSSSIDFLYNNFS